MLGETDAEAQRKSQLDAFIHIDVLNISSVYTWRLEQEHHLASTSGSAMTDAQVRDFVDTCKFLLLSLVLSLYVLNPAKVSFSVA